MRHAAGQPPHRLHLLGLRQLIPQVLLLELGQLRVGDVGDDAVPQRPAVGQALGVGQAQAPPQPLPGQDHAELAVERFEGPRRIEDVLGDPVDVLGMQPAEDRARVLADLLGRDLVDVRHAGTRVGEGRTPVGEEPVLVDHARHQAREIGQQVVRLGDPAVGRLELGDVHDVADDLDDPPLGQHRFGGRPDMDPAAVAHGHGGFEVVGLGVLDAALERGFDAGAVLRIEAGERGFEEGGGVGEFGRGEPVDPARLLGPGQGSRTDLPFPSPDPGQPLGGAEDPLAVPERLLNGPELVALPFQHADPRGELFVSRHVVHETSRVGSRAGSRPMDAAR